MENIGGGLAWGEVLRGSEGRSVSSDPSEGVEPVEFIPRSLPGLLSGRASLSSELLGEEASCRNDEAEDLSDRRLDFPVKTALVRE